MMTNKKYFWAAAVLIFAMSAAATEALSAENVKAQIKNVSQDKKEARAELASTTAAMKQKLADDLKIKNKIMLAAFSKQVTSVGVRVGATIDRLQNIEDRVNSRIEKIKNAGAGDTTAAEGFSSQAQASLNSAKTSFDSMKNSYINAMASTTVASLVVNVATSTAKSVASLRKMEQGIEKNLQSAQKYLSKAVDALGKLPKQAESATTTKGKND